MVDHTREGRREIAQRLAGAGAGLDQQVLTRLERLGDGVGHLLLARTRAAPDALDGGLEDVTMIDWLAHRSNLSSTTDRTGLRTGPSAASG
ncbi:hypothetical protein GCM10027418_29640 [Mariniluteicoccus endophyticus]